MFNQDLKKRLNFLKDSLDHHNPLEVAQKSREDAEDVKAKRVWAIWKHDLDDQEDARAKAVRYNQKLAETNRGSHDFNDLLTKVQGFDFAASGTLGDFASVTASINDPKPLRNSILRGAQTQRGKNKTTIDCKNPCNDLNNLNMTLDCINDPKTHRGNKSLCTNIASNKYLSL